MSSTSTASSADRGCEGNGPVDAVFNCVRRSCRTTLRWSSIGARGHRRHRAQAEVSCGSRRWPLRDGQGPRTRIRLSFRRPISRAQQTDGAPLAAARGDVGSGAFTRPKSGNVRFSSKQRRHGRPCAASPSASYPIAPARFSEDVRDIHVGAAHQSGKGPSGLLLIGGRVLAGFHTGSLTTAASTDQQCTTHIVAREAIPAQRWNHLTQKRFKRTGILTPCNPR